MESVEFLPDPKIKGNELPYVNPKETKDIYVNLFKIIIKREIKLYQHPYKTEPQISAGILNIRAKLYKSCEDELTKTYGECFILGDSLYSLKKQTTENKFKCIIFGNGRHELILCVQPCVTERTINQSDIESDSLTKQFIEIIIKDILHSNPNLEFYKGLFVSKDNIKLKSSNLSYSFYPGYTTSLVQTEKGKFLNVNLKNKILSNETILQYLEKNNYKKRENKPKIKEYLINKSFQVKYAKKNYIISDIDFDKNPVNKTCNYNGKTIKLSDYYKDVYKINIKNKDQPLLIVEGKQPQGKKIDLFFIPELCTLSGLDDEDTKNRYFMKDLAKNTKFHPNDKVYYINNFLKLLIDDKKDGKSKSAKEKSEIYGIEIKENDMKQKAYYMERPKLIGGSKKNVTSNRFEVISAKDMTNWACLYRDYNYDIAGNLSDSLIAASKSYKLKICEPDWGELGEKDGIDKWIKKAEEKLTQKKVNFIVFLLDNSDKIYRDLKIHSLCTRGYVSQVVKVESLQKNILSVCSKILLQINAKLSGVPYILDLDKETKDRKLMVIGVDSSRIKGKSGAIGVGMVATINTSFSNYYNKEFIIKPNKKKNKNYDEDEEEEEEEEEEDNKGQLKFCISKFIEEAIVEYKKLNKNFPKGIIIYRQGVSLQQKNFLKSEMENIKTVCDEKNIHFYYILVNTKTTYKFFEKIDEGEYKNPGPGLLVLDGVTHKNFFEFYIQPQQVTEGSATPSCYHVAYGNLNFPEMVPKLTYYLCYLYNNWQGTVRVPNVLKGAEKISKMTAKYTRSKLNEKLKIGQSYL